MYKNNTFLEFQNMFPTEKECEEYLFNKRWKNGFVCTKVTINITHYRRKNFTSVKIAAIKLL